MTARYLIFEDGSIFEGEGFGSPAVTFGEMVFNTSMTGYQEIITNQIYHNQIVVFTNPNIGNYGIQRNIYESIVPSIKGVVCRNLAPLKERRHGTTLDQYLKQMNIPGVTNVDTRAIVRHLRKVGQPMKGSIVPVPDDHAFDQLHATVLTNQQVAQVATPNVTVLPYTASVDDILRLDPDGVVLSSGPGNPESLKRSVLEMIRQVEAKVPMFAIGLGHELFALANGCKVERLATEHHGMNHPIREIITDHIVFAFQGEGYVIRRNSVDRSQLFITYVDMLDGTVQGLRHRHYPAFSVQFFPDGAPGPDETNNLFDEFMDIMKQREEGWR